MKKSIIKLKFKTPIHIGNRNLSDSVYDLKADTIFSALCIESGNIEKLVSLVKEKKLKISDGLPYVGDYYYIPKPMLFIKQETEEYKLFKKIKYITEDALIPYLEGTLYPKDEIQNFTLGEADLRTRVCVGEDPYQVGLFTFHDNSGLYIIVEHEDEYIFDIFESLKYSGMGGKRSSGFGKFDFSVDEAFVFPKGNKKILLNTAMARPEELNKTLEGANYLLEKRSGFIHGSRFKKTDFYSFKAGSVFENDFEGDIFDVGNDVHPVYRYGVPMFLEVKM